VLPLLSHFGALKFTPREEFIDEAILDQDLNFRVFFGLMTQYPGVHYKSVPPISWHRSAGASVCDVVE
jgi:hypothetical protein